MDLSVDKDIEYVVSRLAATEPKKCSECGKDNPFSGAKAGCKTCKRTIQDTAKQAEADRESSGGGEFSF